jgi:hypothetical protein
MSGSSSSSASEIEDSTEDEHLQQQHHQKNSIHSNNSAISSTQPAEIPTLSSSIQLSLQSGTELSPPANKSNNADNSSRYCWLTPLEKAKIRLDRALKLQKNKLNEGNNINNHGNGPVPNNKLNAVQPRPKTANSNPINTESKINADESAGIPVPRRPQWWQPLQRNETNGESEMIEELLWKRRFGFEYSQLINDIGQIKILELDRDLIDYATAQHQQAQANKTLSASESKDNLAVVPSSNNVFEFVYNRNEERKALREQSRQVKQSQRVKQTQQEQLQRYLELDAAQKYQQHIENSMKTKLRRVKPTKSDSISITSAMENRRIGPKNAARPATAQQIQEFRAEQDFPPLPTTNKTHPASNEPNSSLANPLSSPDEFVSVGRYNPRFAHPAYQVLFGSSPDEFDPAKFAQRAEPRYNAFRKIIRPNFPTAESIVKIPRKESHIPKRNPFKFNHSLNHINPTSYSGKLLYPEK